MLQTNFMKTKKILISILTLCAIAAVLAGCGGAKPKTMPSGKTAGSSVQTGSGSVEPVKPGTTANKPEAGKPIGNDADGAYHVGAFSLTLAKGWKAFPQTNVYAEMTPDGNYPIDEELIYVSKEAEKEIDLLEKPYISIKYAKPGTALSENRSFYQDIKELTVSVKGADAAEGFEGKSVFLDNSVWQYQFITVTYAKGQLLVIIPTVANGETTGLTWDAPEVLSMIESITIDR